jgi:hypothetical protein
MELYENKLQNKVFFDTSFMRFKFKFYEIFSFKN